MARRLTLLLLSGHTVEVRTDKEVRPARGPNEYAASDSQLYELDMVGSTGKTFTVSPALIAGVITHSD
jgi:hypothetical protein